MSMGLLIAFGLFVLLVFLVMAAIQPGAPSWEIPPTTENEAGPRSAAPDERRSGDVGDTNDSARLAANREPLPPA